MKTAELNKLFEKSEVEITEDREVDTRRVFVKKLNREFFVETNDDDDARKQALEIVMNESDRVRGFEIDDAKS